MMKKLLYLFSLSPFLLQAQTIHIIPEPALVKQKAGHFYLTPATKIVLTSDKLNRTASLFNDYLQQYYGFTLPVVNNLLKNDKNVIALQIRSAGEVSVSGAYTFQISGSRISIAGDDPQGVFYGVQSLIQLLPLEKSNKLILPCVDIEDAPRFAYRGLNIDVSRHFFDVAFIKKYIDLMALYKINTFHWHLTDDQGWRIEIKKYPLLTQTGSVRNGTIKGRYPGTGNDNTSYGGYYTQQQIREVVAYADARYITVIPEIEMPGHSSAAISAYPWLSCFPKKATLIPTNMVSLKSVEDEQENGRVKLVQETWGVFDDVYCAGKDSTFTFLEDVLDEVLSLFPSKYIHVGGDECPKTDWKQCPLCQRRMKENQLKDEHALQSYFIQRIEKYLNSKGRQIIGWDEILEGGLAPNATVMSWRGEAGGIQAARLHHDVIMTPGNFCYFSRSAIKNDDSAVAGGYLPIEKVYGYNPVSDSLTADQAKYVIGAQASLWSEYISSPEKAEYMILPRLGAMSEVMWTEMKNKDWTDFRKRMANEQKRYEWLGFNYNHKVFSELAAQ